MNTLLVIALSVFSVPAVRGGSVEATRIAGAILPMEVKPFGPDENGFFPWTWIDKQKQEHSIGARLVELNKTYIVVQPQKGPRFRIDIAALKAEQRQWIENERVRRAEAKSKPSHSPGRVP